MLLFNKGLENDFAQLHSQHLHRNEKILNKRMKLLTHYMKMKESEPAGKP